jgi:hypothetical protein
MVEYRVKRIKCFRLRVRDRAGWARARLRLHDGLFTGCNGFCSLGVGVLVLSLVLYVLGIALVVGGDQPAQDTTLHKGSR